MPAAENMRATGDRSARNKAVRSWEWLRVRDSMIWRSGCGLICFWWHINGAGQDWLLGSNVYSVPGFQDPRHDALLALMDWVEGGKAVDQIIATTWHNQTNPSSGVLRQRPLCPYPKKAVYDGVGDTNEAQSWKCE